jgi:hypothetical protein
VPTGKITFPGGLSAPNVHSGFFGGPDRGVRGASFGAAGGVKAVTPGPNVVIDYGAQQTAFYAGFVPEVAKANYLAPSNQGRVLQNIYNATRMDTPRNNPSRSQFLQGYTQAIQAFAASNTWNSANGTSSVGSRAKQPSTKFVSPFSSLPIPTAMPWDL